MFRFGYFCRSRSPIKTYLMLYFLIRALVISRFGDSYKISTSGILAAGTAYVPLHSHSCTVQPRTVGSPVLAETLA